MEEGGREREREREEIFNLLLDDFVIPPIGRLLGFLQVQEEVLVCALAGYCSRVLRDVAVCGACVLLLHGAAAGCCWLAVDTLPAHRHALMRYGNVLLKS